MPWLETGPMQERMGLILDVLEGRYSVTEAAERRCVSRKTAYKYLDRYLTEGLAGLEERSRKPHQSPRSTSNAIRELVIAEKRTRPDWGPKKLVNQLRGKFPHLPIPAPSTAGDILKAAGQVERRRRRRVGLEPAGWQKERTAADRPNQVWTIDFKGQFRMGNGALCFPLTLIDLYSRAPRAIDALPSTHGAPVRERMQAVFERDGLPDVIRSDCGLPFAGHGLGRLSRLAVWLLRLGIRLERNDPGHPEQNGAHERMHRTLKAETTRPPQFDLTDQQQAFDVFRQDFNEQRPHEGIGMRRPAELYTPSSRLIPAALPELTYPGHFEIRTIGEGGRMKWKRKYLFVSEALQGERVGIEGVDEGVWAVHFGPMLLGRFTTETWRVS